MANITDITIDNLLTSLNIPHLPPPYTHIQNNNYAVTDSKNFFIKTTTSRKSLEIESQAIQLLNTELTLLHPDIIEMDGTFHLITKYIPHYPTTPENLTDENTRNIIENFRNITLIDKNLWGDYRKLEATIDLIQNRITTTEDITPTELKTLNLLIEQHIQPYIAKYANYPTLAHTDAKLDNILTINNTKIVIVDYESIKPSPPEIDLASLYQDLYQTGSEQTYKRFEKEYKKQHPEYSQVRMDESILFKNTLTTTAALKLPNQKIFKERLEILHEALKTRSIPTTLPKVEMNQKLG